MANFEVFENAQSRRHDALTLTITARRFFTLSSAAYAALGTPVAVELLYDRDEQVIGLRPAEQDTPHAYAVRYTTGRGDFSVSGSAFMTHYDIPATGGACRRPAIMIDGVLCVDLKEPGIAVTSNRAKQLGAAERLNGHGERDRDTSAIGRGDR